MTFRVKLEHQAAAEIRTVSDWIEQESPAAARRWVAGIMAKLDSLETMPARGAIATEETDFEEEVRQIP